MSPYLCPQAKEWLTLMFMPGLGPVRINRLVDHFHSPRAILHAADDVLAQTGLRTCAIRSISDERSGKQSEAKAVRELERIQALGVSLVSRQCSRYPPLLKEIADPPPILYYKGMLPAITCPVIAIVGSRAATEYGKRTASNLAGQLTQSGIAVVSGGAYGVDTAAHRGVLNKNGLTIAVFGCGIDVVYPKPNRQLFTEIERSGAVVSEYPLGTKPEGFRFPERNRIISGLAAGIIVVEASLRSGALITARLALDQGRDLFAVPGRIDSPKSYGCHRLIQQGALLVQSVEDVLETLSLKKAREKTEKDPLAEDSWFSDSEQKVLSTLDAYPVDIDTISRVSGIAASEIHGVLLQLELKGRIRQVAGQQYEKIQ
ncbi:MAG: DNA-protecting protein DprA [Desulfobulbus propionicus]|nr:MAG: DNA-protecting protein DprA [Desulfobulbus propionicus]